MFNKTKETKSGPTSMSLNVLGHGTIIEGNLNSSGDIRIDGVVKGNVKTDSKFVLGDLGRVEGNIEAKNCDISGEVKGDVKTLELLVIKNCGVINGDINTEKLVVESGGKFNGKCQMGQVTKMNFSKDKEQGNPELSKQANG